MASVMETMIVTGGAGFIGSNFVRLLIKTTACRVVVFDKLTYAGNLRNLSDFESNPRFAFVKADISDPVAVEQAFFQWRPDAIVNFAAESHVDRSIDGPRAFIQTNIVGTFELLEAARKFFSKLKEAERARFRFLHVSTDEVYGTLGSEGLFSEATPYAPNSPYSASKASADHLVRAYHETFKLPTLITNCSNNYGPHQFPEKLIPLTILNAVEGKPLPIYGNGGNIRDWLYVEDHCTGVLLALRKGHLGEKYNIGGSSELTNLEVVERICATLERMAPAAKNQALISKGIKSYEALKTFVPDRPGHDWRYAIDSSKIRKELAWKPEHDFDSGLEKTVRWYLAYRNWCGEVRAENYRRERLGLGTERE